MASTDSEMPCCTTTAWGKLIETEISPNKGSDITMGGDLKVPAYITDSPSESKKGVVIFPDVYGVTNRVRAIADTIASEGYVVLVVDCYYGDTVVKTPDMVEFLSKFSYDKISKEIGAAIDFLVSKSVDKESIAALGFCWGGWAIAKSASEGVCWKCAVSPHPATKVEGFIWKNDEKAMFEKFPMPFLLMPAADDPDLLKPGSSVVDLLEEKGGKSVPFPRMKHGWVSRGDLSKDEVKEDAEKALQLATDFIKANN